MTKRLTTLSIPIAMMLLTSSCLSIYILVPQDPNVGATQAASTGDEPAATRTADVPSPPGPRPDCTPPERMSLDAIPISEKLAGAGRNVLACFEVDGDELVGVSYTRREVAEGALDLWREIVLRIPTNQRLDLVQFQLFEGGLAGYVQNGGTGGQTGRLGQILCLNASNIDKNPADPCEPLSRRRGNFDWTVIHEFSHMRGYADGAINDFTRAFPGKTGPGDGYSDEGWPRLDGDWVTSYAERAGGDEDFAESFTTYVMLDVLPTERSLAAEKVRWFADRPGYPELRRALRITEPDGSDAPIDPVPRLEFPFTVEPATWMIGEWRGETDNGIDVEYRITRDDIVRIHREDGEETARVRYAGLRDGGVLATVDLYESNENFYLHQVSVAGENYSESFRRKTDRLRIEHERLGDFTVKRIEP